MGLVGTSRNYVIVRQGCLARVRDALLGEEVQFLIDAAVFPGNSGGPVVTAPQPLGITGTPTYNEASLIGIITSYVPYRDIAISQQTGRTRVTFDENSGLALVTPFDFIDETINEHRKLQAAFVPTGVAITESQAPPEDMGAAEIG